MKKISLFILLLAILGQSCTSTSKLSQSGISFNEGDDLIYEVRTKDEDGDAIKYEIELNINGVADEYVSFDWEVFTERSGTISMNENAIKNATTLSFFEKAGYQPLDDKTAIWLSQTVFKRLKANEKIEIGLNEQKVVFYQTGTEAHNFGNEKNYNIPVIIVANTDETIKMWVADDAKNPIIVRMIKKDFRMELVNYKVFE